MASSVCINHTDRAGTARCATCHKPICAECVQKSGGSTYCSQKCIENAERFNANYKPDRPGFFGSLKKLIVTLVGLVFVLAVAAVILAKVVKVPFFVDLLKRFGI